MSKMGQAGAYAERVARYGYPPPSDPSPTELKKAVGPGGSERNSASLPRSGQWIIGTSRLSSNYTMGSPVGLCSFESPSRGFASLKHARDAAISRAGTARR
jgi:hypothetical protein